MKIGILHPGKMGEIVASALIENEHEVLWASQKSHDELPVSLVGAERSEATKNRANALGLKDTKTVSALCEEAEVIFSICVGGVLSFEYEDQGDLNICWPVARMLINAGFKGLLVEANDVNIREEDWNNSLGGFREDWETGMKEYVEEQGMSYVDASLHRFHSFEGYEPWTMFLSGKKAEEVKSLITPHMSATCLEDRSAKSHRRRILALQEGRG